MILPTLIVRHKRENLKKCSLRGLEGHPQLRFSTYPTDPWPELSSYVLLKIGAPLLSKEDAHLGLLIIDGTWRLAALMERQCPQIEARSLPPSCRTAYPRRQTDCLDPEQGLASVEALYLAHALSGRPMDGLLDHYHWKDEFFRKNRSFVSEKTV
jgi:pre-rRNA-processing protein TSR3